MSQFLKNNKAPDLEYCFSLLREELEKILTDFYLNHSRCLQKTHYEHFSLWL